ncbi:hypothetical protein JAO73_10385 [Hymenobacter sp. BT523]|uniref:hypothetical protein n=1 Tax=Hymenobacter sp. BT523 TaxID=2795725 RepID=UPI0018EAFC27|nr:hypothetical protein [Hymenobacter sp. BT523]MBJ6109422.1 hypothetical protein [Hymenobacter sp. BT523]
MKLELPCSECLYPGGKPNKQKPPMTEGWGLIPNVPLGNDCIYTVEGPCGHTSMVKIHNFKFEMLFESGIRAMHDGYYREAITSFYVALERFYEFSLGVLAMPKLWDEKEEELDEKSLRDFAKGLDILKSSEKRVGAFHGMYYAVNGVFTKAFPESQISVRNKAIHQGEIKTHAETLAFGTGVHDYIKVLLREYKENFPLGIHRMKYVEEGLAWIKLGGQLKGKMNSLPSTLIYTFINSNDGRYFESSETIEHYMQNPTMGRAVRQETI